MSEVSQSEPSPAEIAQTLAWEEQWRTRTAIAAVLSAVFTVVGGIANAVIGSKQPNTYLSDGLRDAAGAKNIPGGGLATPQVRWLNDHSFSLIATNIVSGLGAALIAVVLGYLFRAVKARRPETPNIALQLALVAPIVAAVAQIVGQVAHQVKASDFVHGSDFSTPAAHDALSGGFISAATYLGGVASLALLAALLLISLNAMRTGLLTRFMGVLGIISAVLLFPIFGSVLPIVQALWLLGLGAMFLGWSPRGLPHAWESGIAEPWPSQQELREQREQERAESTEEGLDAIAADEGEDDDEPAQPQARTSSPSPSASRKRKRKR